MILAGDVGATKILLEVGEFRSERWQTKLGRRYPTSEVDSFSALLTSFLGEWNQVRGKGERITGAGFGVAGAAMGNKIKMTHRPITVDGDAIRERFLIPEVAVVNDLAAAARGLDVLGPRDLVTIQAGKAVAEAPRVVLGIGTGLGVAYLIPSGDGFDIIPGEGGHAGFAPRVVLGIGTGLGVAYLIPSGDGFDIIPGEGGHAGFAPATVNQSRLWQSIFERHGRVSAEDVVSGMGLVNIAHFTSGGSFGETATADALVERAATDEAASAALDLFVECLGSVAGDHALAVMARGGVYLMGGVIARVYERVRDGRFSEAFCAKGAHSATMMKIPVKAVSNERLALLGAAKLVV